MSTTNLRSALPPGSVVLGKYEIKELLHSQGMSNVYIVADLALQKQWVLKEILRSAAGPESIEFDAILREATILSRLNNPGVPRITEINEQGDSVFIVMDYVQGVSVQTILKKEGTIPEGRVVSWMIQVAQILGYLHNLPLPIFYRDIKPANIMVQDTGHVRLLDFGISEIVSSANEVIVQPLGTKGYAPPEQGKVGERYDLRSDIFSFGVTLFYMLTGVSPVIWRKTDPNTPFNIRKVNPNLSVGLQQIVLRCTQNLPEDRYQHIEEVQHALEHYKELDGSFQAKLKRKVWTVRGLALLGVLSIATSGVLFWVQQEDDKEVYATSVANATQTGRFEDYVAAVSLKPTDLSAYPAMIESIKATGTFTPEQEAQLLSVVNPSLLALQTKDGWGDVAFSIGKLYWFFYDGPEDGRVLSVKWFEDALAGDTQNSDEAATFYQMGTFQRDISSSIREGSDSGMYAEYWKSLNSIQNYATGEVVELQSRIMLAQAIDQYSYRLRSDGVPEAEVRQEAESLIHYAHNTKVSPGLPEELLEELQGLVANLNAKIDAGFKEAQ